MGHGGGGKMAKIQNGEDRRNITVSSSIPFANESGTFILAIQGRLYYIEKKISYLGTPTETL